MNSKVNIDAKDVDIHDLIETLLEENRPLIIFFQINKSLGMISTVMITETIREDITDFLNNIPKPQ